MAPRKDMMRPLHLILAILLVSALFYLLVQVRLGYISCNLGRFPGVQGRAEWVERDAKHLALKMEPAKKFVTEVKSSIQNSKLSSKELYKKLENMTGPEGQDVVAFATTNNDEHEKGTLLAAGVAVTCGSNSPYCHTIKKS